MDASRLNRHVDGVPVYRYRPDSGAPPVSVQRASGPTVADRGRHIHDFPVLWYLPDAGVVYVVAAGTPIDPAQLTDTVHTDGVGVYFDPAAVGDDSGSPWPTWRAHPLLFPFLHGRSGGLLELAVPASRRAFWGATIAAIETELVDRLDGYQQAAVAHLTLLLIELARLADDVVGDLRRSGEPLLAEVFSVIERRVDEQLSLRDVAAEVGMTPGHLTTLVRRRTGRTVQDWIIAQRMARARTLLERSDLPIAEVARQVGMNDPGYFSRQFRDAYGCTPREWRRRS